MDRYIHNLTREEVKELHALSHAVRARSQQLCRQSKALLDKAITQEHDRLAVRDASTRSVDHDLADDPLAVIVTKPRFVK